MKSAANSIPWDHGQRQKDERHAAITASGAEPGLKGQLSVVILRPQSCRGGPLTRSHSVSHPSEPRPRFLGPDSKERGH
ncbi:hypothetical protein FDECE_9985 [Fusarium decemcellulare]|nr:hypothetical protein FDECE_9985 [Fusarium decemcellulare]